MLLICHRIVAIGREVITRGEFEKDTPHMTTLQAVLEKNTTCVALQDTHVSYFVF